MDWNHGPLATTQCDICGKKVLIVTQQWHQHNTN